MTRRAPTERQLQLLALIVDGRSNASIANQLHITEDTVKSILRSCYTHLGARDRAHAVAIAYQRGLIAMPRGSRPRVHGAAVTIRTGVTNAVTVATQ